MILSRRRMKFGDALYRAGEVFESVYLVRAGFVKTVVLLEDGREQVTRLCMPGEMLGMDGLASGRHASDAIALATASLRRAVPSLGDLSTRGVRCSVNCTACFA